MRNRFNGTVVTSCDSHVSRIEMWQCNQLIMPSNRKQLLDVIVQLLKLDIVRKHLVLQMLFEPWYELKSDRSRESFNELSLTKQIQDTILWILAMKMRSFSWIKLTLVETRLKVAVWSFKAKTVVVIIVLSIFTHIQAVILMVVQNRHFRTTFIGLREMSQFEKLSCKIARC